MEDTKEDVKPDELNEESESDSSADDLQKRVEQLEATNKQLVENLRNKETKKRSLSEEESNDDSDDDSDDEEVSILKARLEKLEQTITSSSKQFETGALEHFYTTSQGKAYLPEVDTDNANYNRLRRAYQALNSVYGMPITQSETIERLLAADAVVHKRFVGLTDSSEEQKANAQKQSASGPSGSQERDEDETNVQLTEKERRFLEYAGEGAIERYKNKLKK